MSLVTSCTIDQNILTQLLDQVQHIQQLFLRGNFSYFNLDNLANLKVLVLEGTINESFNMELFKNLCNQIVVLRISLTNIDYKTLFKLFDGHTFSYLQAFTIIKYNLINIY